MLAFGQKIGACVSGGEVFELVGDVGAGKTSFTKGLALGMGITDAIQSPTFTISREYDAPIGLYLVHYDFYRLSEAGVMADELTESLADAANVVVVEWAETVADILPKDRTTLVISLVTDDENVREVTLGSGGEKSKQLLEKVGL